MAQDDTTILTGMIFEEYAALNADELGRLCTVPRERINELVEEGILAVETEAGGEWRFSGACLRRARVALRLHHDLGINFAGVALALDLMEELQRLRRELEFER